MAARLGLILVLALGCARPDVPRFPTDERSARALIARATVHEPAPRAAPDAAEILAAIDRGPAAAGWGPVARALREHPQVVFGVHHDARGQHEAFGRLFGPTGAPRAIALELFDARGDWGGVTDQEQLGDSAVLLAYDRAGGERRLERVRARLLEGAYTAWKYDLVDEVLSWVVAARGAQQRLLGCDAPRPLIDRMRGFGESTRLRMRELHCARALSGLGPEPYAVLIGDAHSLPEGLPRYLGLPTVVHAIGGRASDAGVEAELAGRLGVDGPVLIALAAPRTFVLVLPGPHLSVNHDRSRGEIEEPGVFFDPPTEAWRDGHRLSRGAVLPPGDHRIVFRRGAARFVVAVEIGPGAQARVDAALDLPRIDVRVSGP